MSPKLNVNRGIVSPTMNVDPTLLSFVVNLSRDHRFTVLQILSLTKWFFIQISVIHDNVSSQVAANRR